jgi:cation diffusion facilitator family transporter
VNLARRQQEQNTLKLTLILYGFVFVLKLAVYFQTGVMALLAESLHTLSDVFISGFLLLAAILARKEADEGHMFGHARAENVAALVAATLFISFTSFRLYEEGIPRIFAPSSEGYQNLYLAVAVIVFSMIIAFVPLIRLRMQGAKGASARAQSLELINDELALVAALGGTIFIVLGFPIADPIASVIVATIIAYNAIKLLIENARFLLGRSPDQSFITEVGNLARTVPGVLDVHSTMAEYVGPEEFTASLHIEVHKGMTIEEADRIAEQVRSLVIKSTGCSFCTVHVDPAGEESRKLEEQADISAQS